MLSFIPIIGPLFIPVQVLFAMLAFTPIVGPFFALMAFIF